MSDMRKIAAEVATEIGLESGFMFDEIAGAEDMRDAVGRMLIVIEDARAALGVLLRHASFETTGKKGAKK